MGTKPTVPVNCLFQGCYNPEFEAEIRKCKDKCYNYNQLNPNDRETQRKMLAEILGKMGENVVFTPPFWCDYGYNIEFDGFVYVNHNSVFLDCAKIKIGKNTFIGPNCGLYTAVHPTNAKERIEGKEWAEPITIGEGVWLGGNVVVLPGVKIGDRAVIGAGSVVTKDIPADVVAVGNPCKVIKNIEN